MLLAGCIAAAGRWPAADELVAAAEAIALLLRRAAVQLS